MPIMELTASHRKILRVLRTPKAYFEVAEALRKDYGQISPRLTELKAGGLIVKTNSRRRTKYNRTAAVWRRAS